MAAIVYSTSSRPAFDRTYEGLKRGMLATALKGKVSAFDRTYEGLKRGP